jgi:hypothetical protein
VDAVPILEATDRGRNVLSATTPNRSPRQRRRQFCLCGGNSDEEVEVQSRTPTVRGNNSIPLAQAQVLDWDPRRIVVPTQAASIRDTAQSPTSSGGRSQADSFAVHHDDQSHYDRLGVLPRSSQLPIDPPSGINASEERPRHGGGHYRLTSLAEILMLQGALAIGLPMDDSVGRTSTPRINILDDYILPGYATMATTPNEVSCRTDPSSSPEHNRAVSEVTLPLELGGEMAIPVEDDIEDIDRERRSVSVSMEDYVDDKKLEELVAEFNAIHTRQIDKMKRETAACKSILRSINDQPNGQSIHSLASDSSELVNLMQEQYKALQRLRDSRAPSIDFDDDVSQSTTPRSSNSFLEFGF